MHISVLYHELIESLNVEPNGTYVDCTGGGGGHAARRPATDGHRPAGEHAGGADQARGNVPGAHGKHEIASGR